MSSLAVKYRPKEFEEICSQKSIIQILSRQLALGEFKNCYLFQGASGCGKTTLARIFAKKINKEQGEPIEIDGASNNGVDNVRAIIESAKERSLDSEYKIFICDEVHALSNSAWQAFLKCIEEPPKYTIFIFCTTDPQKIPPTIINRLQVFQLNKIPHNEIKERLRYICQQENFTNYEQSIDYISKLANGGMRDAISLLEKVAGLSSDISIENTLEVLGNFSYNTMFDLSNAIIDDNKQLIINIIESIYNKGNDLKNFIEQYLDFMLDVVNYVLNKDFESIKIPSTFKNQMEYLINIGNAQECFMHLIDGILNIKREIKYDNNVKTTIIIMLLDLCPKRKAQ